MLRANKASLFHRPTATQTLDVRWHFTGSWH